MKASGGPKGDLNWALQGLHNAEEELSDALRKGGPQRYRSFLALVRALYKQLSDFVERVVEYSEGLHPLDWLSESLGFSDSRMASARRVASKYASRARTAAETGDGSEHVGVFAPLPPEIAAQFPKKKEDKSRPHVTLCYIGPVPKRADQQELVRAVKEFYAQEIGPVMARLSGVDYFRMQTGCVAYSKVVFSKDMGSMKDRLKSFLEDRGIEFNDQHPLAFTPHVTLGYMDDPRAIWEGPVPEGSWDFDQVEIWGLPKVFKAKLRSYNVAK